MMTGPTNRPIRPNAASPPKMPTNAKRNGSLAEPLPKDEPEPAPKENESPPEQPLGLDADGAAIVTMQVIDDLA